MIGKINPGKGYAGTITYVLGPGGDNVEGRAEVLYHTMSSENPEHWAVEMKEHAQALNPDLVAGGRADLVVHVSLSAAPGERLSEAQWLVVAHEYMQQMGWGSHDFIAVRHSDRPHDHIHLIVNRVGQDGKTADLHNDYQRQAAVLERLEKQFGLEQSHSQMRHAAEADPTRAIASITQSHLTFEARDVQKYFTRLGFSDEQALDLTGRAMGSVQVLGTADGRYTTVAVQREVSTLNDRFATLASRTHGALVDLAPSVTPGRDLSADQQKAREAIAVGRDLTVIQGYAGAGKSAMLDQARADLEQSGYRVIGAAPTGKASAGLHASSHMESSTIARLLGQLERGVVTLDSRTVLVIDEAGMARLDDMSRLAAAVSAAGGRLVLVGDDRQLQAVGRGGAMTMAAQHAPATTLNQIWRQADTKDAAGNVTVDRKWMREATQAFGEGRTADGLKAYIDRDLYVKWSSSVGSSVRDMIRDYADEIGKGWKPSEMLALAHMNQHVDALNHGIRAELKEHGRLQDGRTYDLTRGGGRGDIELAVGDRVVLTKNPSQKLATSLGISLEDMQNGMFGTVVKLSVDDSRIDIQMDRGSFVRLNLDEFSHLAHGYASTVHKAQGASIQQTFALASRGMDSHLAYVSMTRHTEQTRLYGNTVDFKDAGDLIAQLSKSNAAENFKNIIAASVEQKLKNVYGFDDAQVQRYMESHPGLEARLNALGIGPEHQGRYLQDVGNVLEKYGSEMNKIFERYEKILEFRLKPGEFKDTRNQWEKLRDNLWWSMVGPKTPTQYVLYQTARLAAFNVKFASAITYDIGMSTAKAALQLAGVAIKHGVPALADGMKKLGEAFSSASAKEKLVEQFPEKSSAAPANKSAVPAAPDSKSTGVSPEAERKAEREAEKWSAFNPPDEKKYWQHLGEYERYSDMIRGVFDPVKHGLESWRGAAEQEAGREKDGGKSGDSNIRSGQERAEPTNGTERDKGESRGEREYEQQGRTVGVSHGSVTSTRRPDEKGAGQDAERGAGESRGTEHRPAERPRGKEFEGRDSSRPETKARDQGQRKDAAPGRDTVPEKSPPTKEAARAEESSHGAGRAQSTAPRHEPRSGDRAPEQQQQKDRRTRPATATPSKDASQRPTTDATLAPAKDGNKQQAATAPRQNQAQSKGKPQNKTQTQERSKAPTPEKGKSAGKSADAAGRTPTATNGQSKSATPSQSPAKSETKGKTAAAKGKAAPKDKTKDSSNDRGYGRERYR